MRASYVFICAKDEYFRNNQANNMPNFVAAVVFFSFLLSFETHRENSSELSKFIQSDEEDDQMNTHNVHTYIPSKQCG